MSDIRVVYEPPPTHVHMREVTKPIGSIARCDCGVWVQVAYDPPYVGARYAFAGETYWRRVQLNEHTKRWLDRE